MSISQITTEPLSIEQLQRRVNELERELKASQYAREAIHAIAAGTASTAGEAYFVSLVRHIAEVLHVQFVCVTELVHGPKDRLQTIALWNNGALCEDIEYDLDGTPCEVVHARGMYHCANDVQQQFPDDTFLVKLNARSYMGVILKDSRGHTLGHLCIMDGQPCVDGDWVSSVLQLFADRAANELERLRAKKALRASEKKYRTLVESSPYCIKLLNTEGRLLSMNRAGLKMVGEQEESAIIGRHYLGVVRQEEIERIRPLLDQALVGESSEFEFRSVFGTIFRSNFAPIFEADGSISGVLSITQDVTDERNAEAALRTSDERFRLVALATRDAIYDCNSMSKFVWRNKKYQDEFGVEEELPVDNHWWEPRLHPDDRDRVLESMKGRMEKGENHWECEYRLRRKDGTYASVIDRAFIERDVQGNPTRVIGAMTDITDLRRAEKQQQRMVDELDHRVKNNLTSVLALMQQTQSSTTSLESFTETFKGRIRAMAKSHEALASTGWEGVPLQDILRLAIEPQLARAGERIQIEGESIVLSSDASGALTLALHELTTNAIKHGALSNQVGCVKIQSHITDRSLSIDWIETGGPSVTVPVKTNVGLALVQGFVQHDLHGSLEMNFKTGGLVCRITIPVRSQVNRQDEDAQQ